MLANEGVVLNEISKVGHKIVIEIGGHHIAVFGNVKFYHGALLVFLSHLLWHGDKGDLLLKGIGQIYAVHLCQAHLSLTRTWEGDGQADLLFHVGSYGSTELDCFAHALFAQNGSNLHAGNCIRTRILNGEDARACFTLNGDVLVAHIGHLAHIVEATIRIGNIHNDSHLAQFVIVAPDFLTVFVGLTVEEEATVGRASREEQGQTAFVGHQLGVVAHNQFIDIRDNEGGVQANNVPAKLHRPLTRGYVGSIERSADEAFKLTILGTGVPSHAEGFHLAADIGFDHVAGKFDRCTHAVVFAIGETIALINLFVVSAMTYINRTSSARSIGGGSLRSTLHRVGSPTALRLNGQRHHTHQRDSQCRFQNERNLFHRRIICNVDNSICVLL